MIDGVGQPRSYGKYEIFDDDRDALSWDAAEKKAHDQLRKMGIPIPDQGTMALIPSREVRPILEIEQRTLPRIPKQKIVPKIHKKAGEGELPPPPWQKLPGPDHKLEAIARAHILLHYLRVNCCKEHPDHVGWIDDVLAQAPTL